MKKEIIKYSLKNLMARKSRSFLTVLSILIGIAAIFIFASFGLGLYMYVGDVATSAGVDLFFVQAKGMGAPGIDDTFKLEDKDLEAVEKTTGVGHVTYFYMKPGEVEKDKIKKYVYVAGVSVDTKEDIDMLEGMMTVSIIDGRQLKKGDVGKVVLGYNYMLPDKIFPKPYKVGDKITMNDVKFDIVGFYDSVGNPSDDSNFYMLEDDIKSLFGEDTTYAIIIGKVDDVEKIDDTVNRVEKELRKARDLEEGKEDFSVYSYVGALEQFTAVLNIIVGFIFLIVIISAVVSSVNTANTMVTSVLERIKEIGIMKSVGATNANIRNMFLFESGALGFVAGVYGVLIGWGLSAFGGQMLTELGWGFLSPRFHWALFLVCILLATGVGAISGMMPAIYASKQKPVDALRYE